MRWRIQHGGSVRDPVKQMATSESGQFRISPPLEVNSGNVSENYKRWKRQMEVYLAASNASARDGKVQFYMGKKMDQFDWERFTISDDLVMMLGV